MSDSEEELPPCRYGAKCYQTNAAHRKAFSHPAAPSCKHGAKCTDTSSTHRSKYSHPTTSKAKEEDETKPSPTPKQQKKKTPTPQESEDEEDQPASLSAAVPATDGKPACAFGEYCLRTNKTHRRDFTHPKRSIVGLPT